MEVSLSGLQWRLSSELLSITTVRMQLSRLWFLVLVTHMVYSASPRNLKIEYCVSFWEKNITCYWDPGTEPSLPTTYTLYVTEEAGRCRSDFGNTSRCVASRGERSCSILVENLFAFYKIKLTAENELLHTSSQEKCVHGMSIVKLSPPAISRVFANQSYCFQMEWHWPGGEVLLATEAQYEIQYLDLVEESWMQVNFTASEGASAFTTVCGVSPFTNYSVQVRAKYLPDFPLQRDGSPFWSDWSPAKYVKTLPAAPSRGPALWRKVGPPDADGKREVTLMWKPLKPKEANGEILVYSLHLQREDQPAIPQCLTLNLQCVLRLPAQEWLTFLITASNLVDESPATKLVVPPSGEQEAPSSQLTVVASSAGDHSLLLRWPFLSFPRMSVILEWSWLPRKQSDNVSWHYQPGNVAQVVITEAIEPGYLYGLKVFALLDGNVWTSGSTSAYSKQIAPFRAPMLYPARVWKSQVELQWEKIPLEERGGVIQNYTICYEEEGKAERSVVVLDSSVYRYRLEGLAPGSVVRVYITVSNEGGSTSGAVIAIRTKNHDFRDAELLLLIFCVGFLLLLLLLLLSGSLTCLCKHRLLQNYLWPQIPNPAKSNLATWTPPQMCLDFSPNCPETWRQGGRNVGDRILWPKQQDSEPKGLQENRWLAEVAGTWPKYHQTIPVVGKGAASWEHGGKPQKCTLTQNEVEYSRIFLVQNDHGVKELWSTSNGSHFLSKVQDPTSCCLRSNTDIWLLQNMTYEALLDVGPCNRVLESPNEFPLLLSLKTVEGDI